MAIPAFSSPNPLVGGLDLLAAAGSDPALGGSSLTYTWSVLSTPAGAITPSFSANGTNSAFLVSVGIVQAGSYTFRVSIGRLRRPGGHQRRDRRREPARADRRDPGVLVPIAEGGGPRPPGRRSHRPGVQPVDPHLHLVRPERPRRGLEADLQRRRDERRLLVSAKFSKAGTYLIQVVVANPFGQVAISDVTVVVGKAAKPPRKR